MNNTVACDLEKHTPNSAAWSNKDTHWMLGLFGTAIGAGVLFLPINAGLNGLLPLIVMTILVYPMTYLAHKNLTIFVLSSKNNSGDITNVGYEHFGTNLGGILTFAYFFAIFPILLMYSVALTNTLESFIIHQLGLTCPHRAIIAAILLVALLSIINLGESLIVKVMSTLVYPFALSLILLSLYLIPHWHISFWLNFHTNGTASLSTKSFLSGIWLLVPMMVFSFNHSPIISSFAKYHRLSYQNEAEARTLTILKRASKLMVLLVMFFVFSSILSLSPNDLASARVQNISILSYLANQHSLPIIMYTAPLIAFVAIAKSFLGHYLGAREGLLGIVSQNNTNTKNKHTAFIDVLLFAICWLTATLNPSILGMIESLGGPIIAVILFIMPVIAFYKSPSLQRYRSRRNDIFILSIGMIAVIGKILGLLT